MSSVGASVLRKARSNITRGQAMMALAPLWSVLGTLVIVSAFLLMIKADPIKVYGALLNGAAGNWYNFGVTIIRATPLLFAGLAVAFAYRSGLFNIGGEGQLQVGAIASTVVAIYFVSAPGPLRIPIAVLAGLVAGAIWGGIPGVFKAKWGVSEIVVTIMLNYIAEYMMLALVQGPMLGRRSTYPSTDVLVKDSWLPIVFPGTRVHAGFLVAIAATLVVYFILRKTTLGFQIRAVGLNPIAAKFSGISVARNVIIAMLVSGALAGLAGASEILGVQHRLGEHWSAGWGYTAIAVALLGRANPIGVAFAAFFFGALTAGASNMQAMTSLPASLIYIMQATPVLILIGMTSTGAIREFLVGSRKKEGVLEHGSPEHTV